ncbi:diguanylate cyclase (GGDEF)-like protein [Paenibacillus taihuensis]|uniref:Diguanylate cyclase (GGDEF)-like protein n=1 Tax=Paenibacillus taihuensis TaxID=1156355 RepID=A0A3D9SBZ6_9BACL|nr:diguanylate cyclase [Paenibacillus taihuensis]REE90505.1 diguanylate cyclase (GGDEF)-like protein [Paenibacillus taihuensis]
MIQPGRNETGPSSQDRLMRHSKRLYVEELFSKLQQLQQLCAVADMDISYGRAAEIYRIVHSIKGSAPTIGFKQIGELAQQILSSWHWARQASLAAVPEEYDDAFVMQLYRSSSLETLPVLGVLEIEIDASAIAVASSEQEPAPAPAPVVIDGQVGHLELPGSSRILVIDDDAGLRAYLTERLELEGYMVDTASNVQEAMRLLRGGNYQLITLDLMMYPQSGYEILQMIKNDQAIRVVPMIVLSGCNETEDKVRCFDMGADDYVIKPFDYEELSARIRRLLQRNREYELLAFRDPLTGLYNRRFFDIQIEVELNRMNRKPASLSIALIDVDHFKMVNDTYGHQIGDLVLQHFGQLLRESLRSSDIVARWGGEEFVVILPNTNDSDAYKAIGSILQKVQHSPIVTTEERSHSITFSAGISQWRPGLTVEQLIQRADYALYKAKHLGRNRMYKISSKLRTDQSTTGSRSVRKVIVAEDDRVLRMIMVDNLHSAGYQTLEAPDGETAYHMLMTESADLCILDCIMPVMSGLQVLKRMNDEGTRPARTKIMFATGQDLAGTARESLALGADHFITKPFSMQEFEKRVRSLME